MLIHLYPKVKDRLDASLELSDLDYWLSLRGCFEATCGFFVFIFVNCFLEATPISHEEMWMNCSKEQIMYSIVVGG